MIATRTLRVARIAVIASLAAFILSIVLLAAVPLPEETQTSVIAATLLTFFAAVAFYLVAFGWRFAQPDDDDRRILSSNDPDRAYPALVIRSSLSWERSQGTGLFIWAGLISIFVLGYAGSRVSDQFGYAGGALGAALTLLAIVLYGRSVWIMMQARQDVRQRLGRHRWEFAAYLLVSLALAIVAGSGRYLVHSKQIGGAAVVVLLLLLYRIRLYMQDL